MWRLADGAVLQDFSHSGYVIAVAFSPDGKLLATGLFDGPTRLWDVANGNLVRVLNSGATPSLKFSPDGKLLLTASAGLLEFWRVGDGTLLKRYDQNVESGAIVVDISPNGKFFAYGRVDGTVVLAWMPVVIDEFTRTDDTLCLSWWGGSGRYQVQQSTNLTSGAWENAGGPTTNTTFTAPLTLTTAALFYRVQSLTHAP